MKKNILITGAGGFVAAYLINLLDEEENNIVGIDIVENKNIKPKKAHYIFQKLDLLENKIEEIIKFIQPDYIYHLAGISFVPFSIKEPEYTYKINFLATFNLLETIAKLKKFPKTLIVSSGDIYKVPDDANIKITENFELHPRTPYAVSKICSEVLSKKYFLIDKIPLVIVRPFNHTGPGQRDEFAPISFAKQVVQIVKGLKYPLIEIGNVKVFRDYTDVRDVVKSYKLAIEKSNGDIYNVCSGRTVEIEYILNYFISKSKIDIKKRISDVLFRDNINKWICGDNTKIKNELGWAQEISLEKTLDDIYNFYLANI